MRPGLQALSDAGIDIKLRCHPMLRILEGPLSRKIQFRKAKQSSRRVAVVALPKKRSLLISLGSFRQF